MLHLLFTRTKIIAGFEAGEDTQLLSFDGHPYLSYQGHSPLKSVDTYFSSLVTAYREVTTASSSQPIPLTIGFPADASASDRAQVRQQFTKTKSPAFEIIHEDNIALAFLAGLTEEERITSEGAAVIEALENHTNLCFFQPGIEQTPEELLKSNDPFKGEQFTHHMLKDFGPVAGNEKVLSELLKSLTQAGLKVDFKGQTDLAYQLENTVSPFRFQVNQETEHVTLAGEVRLTDEEYEGLMTNNRERLKVYLNTNNLRQNQTERVVLLGEYLHQPSILTYLNRDLSLADKLVSDIPQDEETLYGLMISGLAIRSQRVRELVRLQKEEEARRAKIEAEIKTKEGREELLTHIQQTCVDPSKKEEYEAEFVPRAIELGIPELVIKWNISEVLNKVSLEKEAMRAGIKQRANGSISKQQPTETNGRSGNGTTKNKVAEPAKKPTGRNEREKPKPVTPQPVAARNGGEATTVAAPVAEARTKEKVSTPTSPKNETSDQRKKPALSAIFVLNGTLSGEEFPSRRATFKGDSVVKLVRLLPEDQQKNPDQVKRFENLYEKEKAYYGPLGEISELSESKEGTYYFRDYIERNTLKEFLTRTGLDRKQKVEDLTSDDLKFILQVFKSVQELPTSHANINEENILVLNKRRGILRRGGQAEIRFTGFTSEDVPREKMEEATHQAFTRLLGDKFYSDFRKQFQL